MKLAGCDSFSHSFYGALRFSLWIKSTIVLLPIMSIQEEHCCRVTYANISTDSMVVRYQSSGDESAGGGAEEEAEPSEDSEDEDEEGGEPEEKEKEKEKLKAKGMLLSTVPALDLHTSYKSCV